MDDEKEIQKKQIQILWDYAKQQNDIRCRMYLQFFVVSLTISVAFTLASINIHFLFIIPAILLFLLMIYLILKLRSVTYDLEENWQYITHQLEKLK